MLLLLGWIPLPSRQIRRRTIRNPFVPANSKRKISRNQIQTAVSGVHAASNQHNEKNYEFYWGYKNHVLVDCITGLPIFESTTAANVSDSTVALDILSRTNEFLPLKECSFLADKAYDVKRIYNQIHSVYQGECFIPINPRNTKNPKLLPIGNPFVKPGFAMNKDRRDYSRNRTRQKFCCPFKLFKRQFRRLSLQLSRRFQRKEHRGCNKNTSRFRDDYRLSIDRDCVPFQSVYALRTECERYNSRFRSSPGRNVFGFTTKAVPKI